MGSSNPEIGALAITIWHGLRKDKIHAALSAVEARTEEHEGLGNFKTGSVAALRSKARAAGLKIVFMRIF